MRPTMLFETGGRSSSNALAEAGQEGLKAALPPQPEYWFSEYLTSGSRTGILGDGGPSHSQMGGSLHDHFRHGRALGDFAVRGLDGDGDQLFPTRLLQRSSE